MLSPSSAFPSYISGSPFWVRFLRMWLFFNPAIEVVTFHLHGWCMLGVFCCWHSQGHVCQDLLSLCDGMYVCTDETSVYPLIQKSLRGGGGENGVITHIISKGKKIPFTWKILCRKGSNPHHCMKQDSKLNILPMSYSGLMLSPSFKVALIFMVCSHILCKSPSVIWLSREANGQ